jgi:hypothetical protein
MMLLKLIPMKAYLIGAVLLTVTTGGYLMTQYIKTIGKQELQIEKLEQGIQTRKRIDAAIRNAPSDRDGSVRVLEGFLKSRDDDTRD